MIPHKYLLNFLFIRAIAGRILGANILQSATKPEYSYDLLEAMVNVVKSCHGEEMKTVGIVGDLPDYVVSWFMSEEKLSVVMIDGTTESDDREKMPRISWSKLQLFVVVAHSTRKLRESLINIKNSRWWNHMANFYIVERSHGGKNCTNADAYLMAAWSMNVLEATFICINGTKRITIYTFNPYISDAPEPWRLEKTYNARNDHPWSLFVREYSKDRDTCVNMIIDKTKDLGGYEIVASVRKSILNRKLANKTDNDAVHNTEYSFLSSMFNSWNASVKLLLHEANEDFGSVNDQGIADGILEEIFSGKSDIGLISRFMFRGDILTWAYPHYYSGISVMTQYSGSESQMKKILSLFDVPSRIGFGLVCLLTFIFFKYSLHQTPTAAGLNTLRLICNSCLCKLPSGRSSRIYLGVIFLFVVTIHGIYQGKLASLLAKQVPLSNIDGMRDLRASSHKIYSSAANREYFNSTKLRGRFFGLNSPNCADHVVNDSTAACARVTNYLIEDAGRLKLHVSKNHLISLPVGWVIRQDWPLEKKFNMIVQSLVEADVIRTSFEKHLEEPLRQIRANDAENRDRTFKVLNLEDLKFAFVILGVGLALTSLVFIVELLVQRDAYAKIEKILRSCRLRSG